MTDNTVNPIDRKAIFSMAWIFVTVNYLYCDVMTLMDPTMLKQIIKGTAGGFQITPGFLLGAAILMEIPMAMILLSRVLEQKACRWANIIAGSIMTAVQTASLFAGIPTLYYIFFSVIEISCTAGIIAYAWMWRYNRMASKRQFEDESIHESDCI